MTQINWGIASGPSAFDNALSKGFQLGSAIRERRDEKEYDNALAKVYGGGQAPTGGIVATREQEAQSAAVDQRLGTQGVTVNDSRVDPTALATIARRNPALAQRIQEQERERQEQAQLGQWTQDAMGDDPVRKAAALTQLATKYFDRFQALDKRERDATVAKDKQHGGVALYALQSPNPRSVVQDYAQQSGDPEIAALLQLPDDQLAAGLREKVFEAELAGKLIELEQPKEFNIEPGGARYERDPRTGEIRTIVAPNYGGAPAFSQAPPKQTKQLGGKTYIQDANGDWYEDDGGPTQPASATFRP